MRGKNDNDDGQCVVNNYEAKARIGHDWTHDSSSVILNYFLSRGFYLVKAMFQSDKSHHCKLLISLVTDTQKTLRTQWAALLILWSHPTLSERKLSWTKFLAFKTLRHIKPQCELATHRAVLLATYPSSATPNRPLESSAIKQCCISLFIYGLSMLVFPVVTPWDFPTH
jgi:hypothetical protein